MEGRETGEGGGHWSANPLLAQHQQGHDRADEDAGEGGTGQGAGAALGGPEVRVWGRGLGAGACA